jgi:hypothetical protein
MAPNTEKAVAIKIFFNLRFRLATAMSGMTVRLGQNLSRDRAWSGDDHQDRGAQSLFIVKVRKPPKN